jgi:hypothetical protein
MNEINHLKTFFRKIIAQEEISTSHISIYMTLYHLWKNNQFESPIQITRCTVMQYSKVASKTTYHKCIKELHGLGYIIYDPSYHPHFGSKLYMINLDESKQNES